MTLLQEGIILHLLWIFQGCILNIPQILLLLLNLKAKVISWGDKLNFSIEELIICLKKSLKKKRIKKWNLKRFPTKAEVVMKNLCLTKVINNSNKHSSSSSNSCISNSFYSYNNSSNNSCNIQTSNSSYINNNNNSNSASFLLLSSNLLCNLNNNHNKL